MSSSARKSMKLSEQDRIIEDYRQLLRQHGQGPAVGQWSPEGQTFRFKKLSEIGVLTGRSVLDIGCGLGDFYPFLKSIYGDLTYTGVDIVPELVSHAAKKYPDAVFHCLDLLERPLDGKFDYVLISGVFNNERENVSELLRCLTTVAFQLCRLGLGFNFISNIVSQHDPSMAYHDPFEVFRFCMENLSIRTTMAHHYERCDVAVFVYR
jgi:SAM-dependent methyltransferase